MYLYMVLGVRAVAICIVLADVLQSYCCAASSETRSRRRPRSRGVNGGVSYNFDFPPLVVIDALTFKGAHVLPHGAWGARGRDLHRAGRRLAVSLPRGEPDAIACVTSRPPAHTLVRGRWWRQACGCGRGHTPRVNAFRSTPQLA